MVSVGVQGVATLGSVWVAVISIAEFKGHRLHYGNYANRESKRTNGVICGDQVVSNATHLHAIFKIDARHWLNSC
jgi:hypothetical protein